MNPIPRIRKRHKKRQRFCAAMTTFEEALDSAVAKAAASYRRSGDPKAFSGIAALLAEQEGPLLRVLADQHHWDLETSARLARDLLCGELEARARDGRGYALFSREAKYYLAYCLPGKFDVLQDLRELAEDVEAGRAP